MANPNHDSVDNEVKVKLIRNGLIVKTRYGWLAFDTWDKASVYIASQLPLIRTAIDEERKKP